MNAAAEQTGYDCEDIQDRQDRIRVLFGAAETQLRGKEGVNLGLLINLLRMGHHWAHDEYADLIADHKDLFANDIEDSSDLYELVLNLLEQAHGPLICDNKLDEPATAEVWGYAAPVSRAPSWSGSPLTTEQVSYMWALRIRALDTGHPDQAWYDGHELPGNTWRIAG
jgi:hypothetical protein